MTVWIVVKNNGHTSANNIRLTVNTDCNVINYRKILFEENMTQPKIEEQRLLTTGAPRLAVGSSIILDTLIRPIKDRTGYQVFVTYDQGSTNQSYVLNEDNNKVTSTPAKGVLNLVFGSPLLSI